MSRQARTLSSTGIYHIMLRGINRQQIFEDAEDNEKFLEVVKECKGISGFQLYAYCLMGNHLHLLIKVGKENLGQIFKRIGSRYVYWYNAKYHRSGHLFQDRYKSEPIEDDRYLLTVVRYIHQNPIKAGLVRSLADYPYSSYFSYIYPNENKFVDIDFVLGMIPLSQFESYHNEENEDICMDTPEQVYRLTDKEAWQIIREVSKCQDTSAFQSLEINVRNDCISRLRGEGISIRQICRLTGVSKGIVERYFRT